MGVDYASIERLPHLQNGVIVDQVRAVEAMEGLVKEMEQRYELFRTHGARDIRAYNTKAAVADRLPVIFLVPDEFAEWMLTADYKSAVPENVPRLGVKSLASPIPWLFAVHGREVHSRPLILR